MCSGAISDGSGASLEGESASPARSRSSRLWSNRAGPFDRQQSFRRGAPSRLIAALIYRDFFFSMAKRTCICVHQPLWHGNPPSRRSAKRSASPSPSGIFSRGSTIELIASCVSVPLAIDFEHLGFPFALLSSNRQAVTESILRFLNISE